MGQVGQVGKGKLGPGWKGGSEGSARGTTCRDCTPLLSRGGRQVWGDVENRCSAPLSHTFWGRSQLSSGHTAQHSTAAAALRSTAQQPYSRLARGSCSPPQMPPGCRQTLQGSELWQLPLMRQSWMKGRRENKRHMCRAHKPAALASSPRQRPCRGASGLQLCKPPCAC